jgi:hypothetical protein
MHSCIQHVELIYLSQIIYILTGGVLTPEKLFMTMNLLSLCKMSCVIMLPYGLTTLSEAMISIKRIQV